MKILVAIDPSATSAAAASEVGARPWPPATVVRVLHVMDLFTLTSGLVYSDRVAKAESEAAEALVKSAAERLRSRGLETTTLVLEGYPRADIVDHAASWGADFVFVGSHGHSGIVRFFLGSVAKEVVRTAPCSVEIVRRTSSPQTLVARGAMKILLAADKSACSLAAARSVAGRPWPEGSEVRVVSAIDTTLPAIEPWYGAQEIIARMEEDRARMSEEAVRAAENELSAAGLKVTTAVLEGNPKARIVDAANEWDADLVVLGSHGRRGISRVLLGSVSEAVAMHAHCSVEVIRDRGSSDHD